MTPLKPTALPCPADPVDRGRDRCPDEIAGSSRSVESVKCAASNQPALAHRAGQPGLGRVCAPLRSSWPKGAPGNHVGQYQPCNRRVDSELLGQAEPPPRPTRRRSHQTPIDPSPAALTRRTSELRRFKPAGIEAARQFLDQVRENPAGSLDPPDQLLFDLAYTDSVPGSGVFEQRGFATRREAAEYLAPLLAPIASRIVDQAGVWSWLGMYYFSETAPRNGQAAQLSPLDETFVVDRSDSRSFQLRYRHYLWIAWRLLTQHGEQAGFLLNQPLASWPHISVRCMGSTRIFNSRAVIPLILRLYTGGGVQKRVT